MAGREPELFAGLSFSVLTESEGSRLGECVNLLKQLAAGMSPAERARTARVIESTWWGYRGLAAGFGPGRRSGPDGPFSLGIQAHVPRVYLSRMPLP